MNYKLNFDGTSPFTGNKSLLMAQDDIIEDVKILCTDCGWFTFLKTKTTQEEYDKLTPEPSDRIRNYYDKNTNLIWYPDIQIFFIGDEPISLTPNFEILDEIKDTEWLVTKAIVDEKIDTLYMPDLNNIIESGSYTKCSDKCFQLINLHQNEQA